MLSPSFDQEDQELGHMPMFFGGSSSGGGGGGGGGGDGSNSSGSLQHRDGLQSPYRMRPDSCPELSAGFNGLKTFTPTIPEHADEGILGGMHQNSSAIHRGRSASAGIMNVTEVPEPHDHLGMGQQIVHHHHHHHPIRHSPPLLGSLNEFEFMVR
jgi:hypothetical protein